MPGGFRTKRCDLLDRWSPSASPDAIPGGASWLYASGVRVTRPQLRDPNDEMVLEAAVHGRADAVVTLSVRDYGTDVFQFGVEVLLPRESIARIKR